MINMKHRKGETDGEYLIRRRKKEYKEEVKRMDYIAPIKTYYLPWWSYPIILIGILGILYMGFFKEVAPVNAVKSVVEQCWNIGD